ncbi:MAG: protein kinase [Thermoanaerobaculia bacterium]
MRLSDVKDVIPKRSGADPDGLLARFQDETGSDDPERFLSYLKGRDLVSDQAFHALHAREPMELTEVLPAPPHVSLARDAAGAGHKTKEKARYELLGTVGKGGMGLIWLARDLNLRRKVALKQLTRDAGSPDEAVGRFVREVQITAQLDHPHIVPVYGLEVETDGTVGYAMKLVQGVTFGQFLAETRAAESAGRRLDEAHTLSTRLEHFLKVCDAISYAHGKGVIHRDLKPPNLMLGSYNEVYVMDWGLARLMGPSSARVTPAVELTPGADEGPDATQLGTIMGTPRYMSPDQLSMPSDQLDGRSDQYSLGLILFELITLQPAIPGDSLGEVMAHTAAGRKRPMPAAAPAALAAIVDKTTAFRREDRFESVGALAADVRRFLRDEAVLSLPDTPIQRLLRAMARYRRVTLSVLSFVIAVSSLGLVYGIYRQNAALEAARHREQRLDELMVQVSAMGQGIENHFLQFEGAVQGLAAATVQALTHGTPSKDGFLLSDEFRDPLRRPADLRKSERYHGAVSMQSPVFTLPPGLPLKDALPDIQRLTSVVPLRRQMFLQSGDVNGDGSIDPAEESLENLHRLLIWSFIGLENGVSSFYPGTAIPAGYDPRQRPWYTMSAGKRGVRWGSPHVDAVGTKLLLLPCSTSIFDDTGHFIGVVGLELTLEMVKKGLLAMPSVPAVTETFLLDDEGSILVRSHVERPPTASGEELVLEPFPYRAVIDELRSGTREEIELAGTNPPLLAAFERLRPIHLNVVVLVDRDRLLDR